MEARSAHLFWRLAKASRGHGRGRRFDPDQVHQKLLSASRLDGRSSVRSRPGSPSSTCMPVVYILQSESTQKFYIGSGEDALVRLGEHQRVQTISTRGRGPWTLVYQEQFETLSEARRRERQLKSWKSHRSIQELIDASKRQV